MLTIHESRIFGLDTAGSLWKLFSGWTLDRLVQPGAPQFGIFAKFGFYYYKKLSEVDHSSHNNGKKGEIN